MKIEMDESEHTSSEPANWWELLDDTSSFLRFNYHEIMATGSDELKHAAAIVLGAVPPGGWRKQIS